MKRTVLTAALLVFASSTILTRNDGVNANSVSRFLGFAEHGLADAPAPVSNGAALATAIGLVGAPGDSVFAVRGGGTADFWHYSISQNAWTVLPDTPGPVGDGGALVEIFSYSDCTPTHFSLALLQGGMTSDFWLYDIQNKAWCAGPNTLAPVGAGAAIAQLQGLGEVYVLRGDGTTDFWRFKDGQWSAMASAPGLVSSGAGLVGINYHTDDEREVLYALQGVVG